MVTSPHNVKDVAMDDTCMLFTRTFMRGNMPSSFFTSNSLPKWATMPGNTPPAPLANSSASAAA